MELTSKPFSLDDKAVQWVHDTVSQLTVEEKVGQLFCTIFKFATQEELEETYKITQPGGCMYRQLPYENAIEFTNQLQSQTKIPMLIAANLEKGGNNVVDEGTLLGSQMEVAATDDVEMARKLGILCGREGRAVGINWSFAPIVDIDFNFRNPITNTRTFGSDPERIRDMGLAYARTLQEHGIAACFKHFPGDGCDERDQHLVTSINDLSCEEWDGTYGMIYRTMIDAGIMTCMVGHIMQPAYSKHFNPDLKDEEILPATLSPEILNDLLRGKLGFNGMIVSDATTMTGMTAAMSRRKAVPHMIASGVDMFLFAWNFEEDYQFMMDGVENGTITPERLDEAATRILATKAALGLHKGVEPLKVAEAKKIIGCPEHQAWSKECADRSVTLVKEEAGVLPLSPEKDKKVLFYPIEEEVGVSIYSVRQGVCKNMIERLKTEGFDVDEFIPSTGYEGRVPPTTAITEKYDLIIYVANLTTKSNQTTVRIEWAHPFGANCPHYLNDVPTIFISVENPYHLLDVPRIKTFINTYNSNDNVLDALIEKLMGRSEFKGTSPVDVFCGKWDTHL
jgi:beta-N-acetylhexosaminidase